MTGLLAGCFAATGCGERATHDEAKPVSVSSNSVPKQEPARSGDSVTRRREPEDWIGWHYVELPAGSQALGGDTLTVRDTVYTTQFFLRGGKHLLWLAQGRGKGESGAAEWTVLAAMFVEPEAGENLFTGYCRLNKKPDPAIVALGVHEDLPVFSHMRRVWRIDVTKRSFDEIPTGGIDCLNPDKPD